MKNIVENNKLIAEFMKFEKTKQGGLYISPEGFEWERFLDVENYILPNQFLFHSSWDWLMKVVEKIENLSKEGETYMFSITKFSARVTYKGSRIVDLPIDNTKIEAVYNACVEFIKWYNENKSK